MTANGLRDTDRVVEVAQRVAAEVAAIRAAGRLPLVLGGDCTITLGALDGFGEGGLVYFDGDAAARLGRRRAVTWARYRPYTARYPRTPPGRGQSA